MSTATLWASLTDKLKEEFIMKTYLSLSIASILTSSICGTVEAQLYVTAAVGGVPTASGTTLETFDASSPAILTLSGSAYLVTG